MRTIKVETRAGTTYINVEQLAMIAPLCDQAGVQQIGKCLLYFSGGAAVPFPATPEAMHAALNPPAKPPTTQEIAP